MNEEELININGIREDLYQAMQIGDITLNSKHSQELYDFMNYQDKEIERLNNIIKEVREYCNNDSNFEIMTDFDTFENHNIIGKDILEILDKVD